MAVSISADDTTPSLGQQVTISWNTTNTSGTRVDIRARPDSSNVQISTSFSGSSTARSQVADTVVYEITQYQVDELFDIVIDSDRVSITWEDDAPDPPEVNVRVSSSTLYVGELVTVSWTITGESLTSISDPQGGSSASGSFNDVRTSAGDRAYVARATNAGGSDTDFETVEWRNPPPPSVRVSASSLSVLTGTSVTISWSISVVGNIILILDPFGGSTRNGGRTVSFNTPGSRTYRASAVNQGGGLDSDDVTVTWRSPTPPIVDIDADDRTLLVNEQAVIRWTTRNDDPAASVTVDRDGTAIGFIRNGVYRLTRSSVGSHTFTIVATNQAGTRRDSVTVNWAQVPLPTVEITANGGTVPITVPDNENVTVVWTGDGEQISEAYVEAVVFAEDVGEFIRTRIWDGIPPIISSSEVISDSGTRVTYVYTLVNPAGTVQASVVVTWMEPLPIISIEAQPDRQAVGTEVLVSWTARNFTSVSISRNGTQISTTAPSSRRYTANAMRTDTWTISATNESGSVMATATVEWVDTPGAGISIVPSSQDLDKPATLSWSTNAAETVRVRRDGALYSAAHSNDGEEIRGSVPGIEIFTIIATNIAGSVSQSASILWLRSTADGRWSRIIETPTVDSRWARIIESPSLDGRWAGLRISNTLDSPWSAIIAGLETDDGAWSDLLISPTVDSRWARIIAAPTRDGPWASMAVISTKDSPWSAILGIPTESGAWSDLIILPTQDSPWSNMINNATQDGEWSALVGPVVQDSEWSDFVLLGTIDSRWSNIISGIETANSSWSTMIGPIVIDSAWSPPVILGRTLAGPWADFISTGETDDGQWSNIIGTETADGPWADMVESLLLNSEWSTISNIAHRPRVRLAIKILSFISEWSSLSNQAQLPRIDIPAQVIYRGEWQSSNVAHRPRNGDVVLIIGNSQWSSQSNIAYLPREGPLQSLVYAEWSEVSNLAYKPRNGLPELVLYRSTWSPVSNIARQEREVLSAIGGAEPFLHIYEARKGLVRVMRLVDHVTPDLFGATAFEEAAVSVDRDDDRVLINPLILLGDLRDGQVSAIDVYRTTDSSVAVGAYRFYMAAMEGVDPNIQRVYYDVTPDTLFTGAMPYQIEITAPDDTGISYQRKNADGTDDGNVIESNFPPGITVPDNLEFVVVAVTPQHDDARLSRIVYHQERVNSWYYYHGVPEIYVSDPLDIIASEDASSYNGRDSANFQSPPHVGHASAVVRQHQNADNPWFEQLLDRNHVITGQRVHIMLRDKDFNYGKDFTGILQSPPLQHSDNIYDWRLAIHDPTTLMVQSFANSATLLGPQDAMSSRTIGSLIQRVAQAYADRVANLELGDVLDPTFDPDHFPVPLAWFWTDYESERDIFQRLVNTQGPPAGFYVNSLGQLVFTSCEDRAEPIQIGGPDGIPISQRVSFSDHVVDVANDARIPVSLHGWVLPDAATTAAEVYEEPDGLPEMVQVQLFETYSDNTIFDLARGGNIQFDANGEYRYRVRTNSPVLPPDAGGEFRVVGSNAVTVTQLAANMLDIVVTGPATTDVPSFQVFGAQLKHFRTMEHWTSPAVREENATRFSLYLYHQREFSYSGYNSIAQRDAQLLADWAVRYYRRGIKTMTLQLFCSNHVREALRLEPDRTPVRIAHDYGDGVPDQWIVRSRKRIYRDGHFWIEVVLDEDIMYSLGLEHSPLCSAYMAPTNAVDSATYSVEDSGELTYTGVDGAALIIPHYGFLSIAPNLAATVLPIGRFYDAPDIVKTSSTGSDLFVLAPIKFIAGHFELTRLEALNDSRFYAEGIRAQGLSVWLVEPKEDTDPYWAVMSLNLKADGIAASLLLPAAFHFLRIRYAALGLHADVVLSFVSPPMTIHDGANHWITVAQEQPWLGQSAEDALKYRQHVIILDWQVFPMDGLGQATHIGVAEGATYVTDAVVFQGDDPPSSNVQTASGGQILRKFGRA